MSSTDLRLSQLKVNRLSLVPLIKVIPQQQEFQLNENVDESAKVDKPRSPIQYLRGSSHKKRLTSQANTLSISTNPNSNPQLKFSTFLSGDVCFYSKKGSNSLISSCAQDKISEQKEFQFDNDDDHIICNEEADIEIIQKPNHKPKHSTAHKRSKAKHNFIQEQELGQESEQQELKMNNFIMNGENQIRMREFQLQQIQAVPNDIFAQNQQDSQKRIICDLDDIQQVMDDFQNDDYIDKSEFNNNDRSILLGKINQLKNGYLNIKHNDYKGGPPKIISPMKINFAKQPPPQLKPPLQKKYLPLVDVQRKGSFILQDDNDQSSVKRPVSRNHRTINKDKSLQQMVNCANKNTIYTFLEDSAMSAQNKSLNQFLTINSNNQREFITCKKPLPSNINDMSKKYSKYSCFLDGVSNANKLQLLKKIKNDTSNNKDQSLAEYSPLREDASSFKINNQDYGAQSSFVRLKTFQQDIPMKAIDSNTMSPFKQGFINKLPSICDEDVSNIQHNVRLMNKRSSKNIGVKVINSKNIFNIQTKTTSNIAAAAAQQQQDNSGRPSNDNSYQYSLNSQVNMRNTRNTFYKFMNKINQNSDHQQSNKSLQRIASVEEKLAL